QKKKTFALDLDAHGTAALDEISAGIPGETITSRGYREGRGTDTENRDLLGARAERGFHAARENLRTVRETTPIRRPALLGHALVKDPVVAVLAGRDLMSVAVAEPAFGRQIPPNRPRLPEPRAVRCREKREHPPGPVVVRPARPIAGAGKHDAGIEDLASAL